MLGLLEHRDVALRAVSAACKLVTRRPQRPEWNEFRMHVVSAVGEAFNILGPSPISSIEAAKHLAKRLDTPWRTAPVPFRQAYEVSIAKARAVLGYRPEIDFYRAVDDGLAMLNGEDIGIIPARLPAAQPLSR